MLVCAGWRLEAKEHSGLNRMIKLLAGNNGGGHALCFPPVSEVRKWRPRGENGAQGYPTLAPPQHSGHLVTTASLRTYGKFASDLHMFPNKIPPPRGSEIEL